MINDEIKEITEAVTPDLVIGDRLLSFLQVSPWVKHLDFADKNISDKDIAMLVEIVKDPSSKVQEMSFGTQIGEEEMKKFIEVAHSGNSNLKKINVGDARLKKKNVGDARTFEYPLNNKGCWVVKPSEALFYPLLYAKQSYSLKKTQKKYERVYSLQSTIIEVPTTIEESTNSKSLKKKKKNRC